MFCLTGHFRLHACAFHVIVLSMILRPSRFHEYYVGFAFWLLLFQYCWSLMHTLAMNASFTATLQSNTTRTTYGTTLRAFVAYQLWPCQLSLICWHMASTCQSPKIPGCQQIHHSFVPSLYLDEQGMTSLVHISYENRQLFKLAIYLVIALPFCTDLRGGHETERRTLTLVVRWWMSTMLRL